MTYKNMSRAEYHRQYYKKNKQKILEHTRAYHRGLKENVLLYYGMGSISCALCNHRNIESLSIDHINGGGHRHRKITGSGFYNWLIRNNYPDGFRVLCMNCQWEEMAKNRGRT